MLDTINGSRPLVVVVDDDEGMQETLADLLLSLGADARCFGSVQALLADQRHHDADCILLDVQMPGMTGLEAQERLVAMGADLPIIFMTGYGSIPMSVQAIKKGACDFLVKPFSDTEIIQAINGALKNAGDRRSEHAAIDRIAALAATLTPREREVMDLVTKGRMNKQIAYELGIAEITVKLHRGKVMRKMEVNSVAELVKRTQMLRTQSIEQRIVA